MLKSGSTVRGQGAIGAGFTTPQITLSGWSHKRRTDQLLDALLVLKPWTVVHGSLSKRIDSVSIPPGNTPLDGNLDGLCGIQFRQIGSNHFNDLWADLKPDYTIRAYQEHKPGIAIDRLQGLHLGWY